MWIFLVDVQPHDKGIRAVLAESQLLAKQAILAEYADYKVKPSIRIYAGYRLLSLQLKPCVIHTEVD